MFDWFFDMWCWAEATDVFEEQTPPKEPVEVDIWRAKD